VDTGVEVRTAGGNTFFAQQLVVAAGSWMTKLLPELQVSTKHLSSCALANPCRLKCTLDPASPIHLTP